MAITGEPQVDERTEERDAVAGQAPLIEPAGAGWTITAGGVFRFVILLAIIAFLGIYVGPSEMAKTLFKVAIAVGLSAFVFIGANKLFDQAYPRWTLFNTAIGAACGFVGYIVLECNGLFRTLFDDRVTALGSDPFDINPWLWGLVGAGALGLVMFVLSAPRQQLARLPLATIGVTAFGVLTALAFNEDARPSLDWAKVWICTIVGAVLLGGIAVLRGRLLRRPLSKSAFAALTGAAVGWLVGAWGGGDVGRGNLQGVLWATVVPAALLGIRFGLTTQPEATERRRIERKSRSWIFLLPALVLILGGLVVPLIKTVYQSFRNRDGSETVGLENYRDIFGNENSFNLDNWSDFLTSRLFWAALVIGALAIVIGVLSGRRTRQVFDRSEVSTIPLFVAFFLLACAVLSTVRGTIFNNLWWVIVVTTLATALGLGVAVLADRARGEQVAKALIFLPMAISFVGAGIIWRFMYIARPPADGQTGVVNSLWVWLGEISNSDTGKWIAVAVLAAIAVGLLLIARRTLADGRGAPAGIALGMVLIIGYLIYRFIGPGLGGFVTADGETSPETVIFFQDIPFNNLWLMVILIWIQTGFAMVILSSAIKAVPTELTEAARIDGATPNQVFWRVIVPQIAPTIGVVVTTLIVTVMKVFDIVRVTTGGQSDTEVIANQMFDEAFGNSNEGLGGALATILFVSVLPVMYINIRRMQKARV